MSATEIKRDYAQKCKDLKTELKIEFDEKLAVELLKLVMGEKDQGGREENLKELSKDKADQKLMQGSENLLEALKRLASADSKSTAQDDDKAFIALFKHIKTKVEELVTEHSELKPLLDDWNLFFQATYAIKDYDITNLVGKGRTAAKLASYGVTNPWQIEAKARASLARLHEHSHTPAQKKKLIAGLEEIHFLIGLYSCTQFLFSKSTKIAQGLTLSKTGLIWFHLQARILLAQVERLEAQLEKEEKSRPAAAGFSLSSSVASQSSSDPSRPQLDLKRKQEEKEEEPAEFKGGSVDDDEEKEEEILSKEQIEAVYANFKWEDDDENLEQIRIKLEEDKDDDSVAEKEESEDSIFLPQEFKEIYSRIYSQVSTELKPIEKLLELKAELLKAKKAAIAKELAAEAKIWGSFQGLKLTGIERGAALEQVRSEIASFDKRRPMDAKDSDAFLTKLGVDKDNSDYIRLKYFLENNAEYWTYKGYIVSWFVSAPVAASTPSQDLLDELIKKKKEPLIKLLAHDRNITIIEERSEYLKKLITKGLEKQDKILSLASLKKEIARRKQIKEAEEKEREERKALEQKRQEEPELQRQDPDVKSDEPASPAAKKKEADLVLTEGKISLLEWLLLGIISGGGLGAAAAANFPTVGALLPTIVGLGFVSPFILLGALGAVTGLAIAALFQSLPLKENQEGLWRLALASTLISGAGIALLITLVIATHPAIDTLVIAGVIGTLTALLFLAVIHFVVKKMSEAGVFGFGFGIEIGGSQPGAEARKSPEVRHGQVQISRSAIIPEQKDSKSQTDDTSHRKAKASSLCDRR